VLNDLRSPRRPGVLCPLRCDSRTIQLLAASGPHSVNIAVLRSIPLLRLNPLSPRAGQAQGRVRPPAAALPRAVEGLRFLSSFSAISVVASLMLLLSWRLHASVSLVTRLACSAPLYPRFAGFQRRGATEHHLKARLGQRGN
jgi:hypothetical protein